MGRVGLDTDAAGYYINVFWLVVTFVMIKQFDPGQRRQTGLILMQILFMGSISLSFLRFAVCQTWLTLQTQTRYNVMRLLVGLYDVQRWVFFVKLIK